MAFAARGASAPSGASDYKIWQVILAAAVGTMIEWYDLLIFGALTVVLALKFYRKPSADWFDILFDTSSLHRRFTVNRRHLQQAKDADRFEPKGGGGGTPACRLLT